MIRTRAAKVAGIKPAGDDLILTGAAKGKCLVLGWGSTYGAIKAATIELQAEGIDVAACHVRYLNPLPARLKELCKNFEHVLVPELNRGQLLMLVRSEYLVDAKPLSKVRGQPFTIGEIKRGVKQILAGETPMLKAATIDKGAVAGG
jgi:2-oxoglutarate ferredoxin oxidoreductase subunit alpha